MSYYVIVWVVGDKQATQSETVFESKALADMFCNLLDTQDGYDYKVYTEVEN